MQVHIDMYIYTRDVFRGRLARRGKHDFLWALLQKKQLPVKKGRRPSKTISCICGALFL